MSRVWFSRSGQSPELDSRARGPGGCCSHSVPCSIRTERGVLPEASGLDWSGDAIGKLTEEIRHEHLVRGMFSKTSVMTGRSDRLNIRLALTSHISDDSGFSFLFSLHSLKAQRRHVWR